MTKFLAGIAVTLVIIALAGGAFYFGTKYNPPAQEAVPTIIPSSIPSPTPTATPVTTKTVTGGGILSFPKYRLTVPLDWVETRETSGKDMEKVILKKPGYEISILEGGFGGAMCLFPGDPDSEGPSSRYDQFTSITTTAGNAFRRVGTLEKGKFSICEKTQYGWGQPVSYGHISVTTPPNPTAAQAAEVDTILASFEKL